MDEFIEPKAKIETEFFLATVAEVDDEDGISIIPEGQTSATGKKYKMLINGGFTPEAGDRVVVLKQSGTFVILGKIGYPEDNTGGGGVIYPIAVDKGGTGATDAAGARTNLGAVNKAGDTMTGSLTISNTNPGSILKNTARTDGETVSATTNSVGFRLVDKNGKVYALFTDRWLNDGRQGVWIVAIRGSVYHGIRFLINSSGEPSVVIDYPAAFRAGLGLGTSGAFPITLAQGGTGVDASTAAGKITAMNNLGGVKQIQLTGMTANTTASLISAMSAGIGSIPVGPSFVVCGDSNVSARAVVVFQKTGTNTGKGFVISPYAALYNKWITDSNGTWTTYGPEDLIQTTTVNQIATAASGWQITSASYSERGRIAQVEINIKTTAQKTITNTDPIATIVSGKRPVADSPCQVWLSTSRNAIIKPDGTICTNAGTINSGTAFTLLAIYLVNA